MICSTHPQLRLIHPHLNSGMMGLHSFPRQLGTSKTSSSFRRKLLLLPITAPIFSLSEFRWLDAYFGAREELHLPIQGPPSLGWELFAQGASSQLQSSKQYAIQTARCLQYQNIQMYIAQPHGQTWRQPSCSQIIRVPFGQGNQRGHLQSRHSEPPAQRTAW